MKVAFVIQRYGNEVTGGSELLCRLIAKRMSRCWDLEFLRFLDFEGGKYELFFFFIYLYVFKYYGLPKVADRSILIPTAHDEPSFHLPIFEPIFSRSKGLIFQTPEERDLVLNKFQLQ